MYMRVKIERELINIKNPEKLLPKKEIDVICVIDKKREFLIYPYILRNKTGKITRACL